MTYPPSGGQGVRRRDEGRHERGVEAHRRAGQGEPRGRRRGLRGEPNSAGSIAKMQAIGLAKARGASEWIKDFLGIEQGGDISQSWRELGLDEDAGRHRPGDQDCAFPTKVGMTTSRQAAKDAELDDATFRIRFDGSTPGRARRGRDRFKTTTTAGWRWCPSPPAASASTFRGVPW